MKNKNIKITAFDIDGTIVPYTTSDVSQGVVNMFKAIKEKGLYTFIVTGRDMITIGNVIDTPYVDYFIGANGAFIYDMTKKQIVWEAKFDFKEFSSLAKLFKDNNVAYSVMSNEIGYRSENFSLNNWFLSNHVNDFKLINELQNDRESLHIITVKTDDEKLIQKVENFIQSNDLNMVISSKWSRGFFIAPKGINKAATINFWAKAIGGYSISENVIAFGDSENDYEMIKESAIGVAVANAMPEIKQVADKVCEEVTENGPYKLLVELGII